MSQRLIQTDRALSMMLDSAKAELAKAEEELEYAKFVFRLVIPESPPLSFRFHLENSNRMAQAEANHNAAFARYDELRGRGYGRFPGHPMRSMDAFNQTRI